MRKVLLFALLLTSNFVIAQTLLAFDFDNLSGTNARASSAFQTNPTGILPSTITRGPGLQAQPGTGTFPSQGFTTANTVNVDDYITFTLTPQTNYRYALTIITVFASRTADGPTSLVIRTSLDNFAANATNVVTVTETGREFQFIFPPSPSNNNISTPVEIRIYGFNAANPNGNLILGGRIGADILVEGAAPIALPVKFDNVKVVKKASGIQVSFSNLTESDVINYTIERSANGQQYTTVKEMAPAKNDGGRADYAYTDAQPLSGVNHYRIKVTEQTGKTVYSTPVKWNAGLVQPGLTIYPNPVKGAQLSFQVNNLAAGMYKVAILNTTGQVVTSQSIKHEGGSLAQTISTQQLKKGMYYLEVNGAEPLRKAFVVQ